MKEARQILNQYLNEDDAVVVAVSGGPDSMALLHILIEFRKTKNIEIICAHVNHKVRKESDSEEIFVKEYCHKNHVIFEKMCIEHYNHDNFHNDARKKRYDFFEKVIVKYQAKYLFTAHHGDDLIESILMRIVRGSSLKGYSGISKVQDRGSYFILRPLLNETKESLMLYNLENQIEYVTDNSNFKDVYTRNRYRKNILPYLKEENKNVHKKFLKFSETILETDGYIEKIVNTIYKQICENQILNITLFKKEDMLIQKRVLMRYLEEIYNENLSSLSDEHVHNLTHFILYSENGKSIDLPMQITFIKNDNKLSKKVKKNFLPYKIEFKDYLELSNDRIIEKIEDTNLNDNTICRLSLNEEQLPLFIRTRKEGDKMSVKNMNGRKKINDIFTDLKIPLEERDKWPILVDKNDEILWLPGLKKSKYDIEKSINCDIILKYR